MSWHSGSFIIMRKNFHLYSHTLAKLSTWLWMISLDILRGNSSHICQMKASNTYRKITSWKNVYFASIVKVKAGEKYFLRLFTILFMAWHNKIKSDKPSQLHDLAGGSNSQWTISNILSSLHFEKNIFSGTYFSFGI